MTATLTKRPMPSVKLDAQNEDVKTTTAVRPSIRSKSRNDVMLTINTGYLLHAALPIASFSTIFHEFSQSRRKNA
ncbi:MAG: hypothetical protein Q7J64_02950 [Elusimicrobiota bacterium]|nr:hypothetical protein [Elusimicrobiota bacterium]